MPTLPPQGASSHASRHRTSAAGRLAPLGKVDHQLIAPSPNVTTTPGKTNLPPLRRSAVRHSSGKVWRGHPEGTRAPPDPHQICQINAHISTRPYTVSHS